MKGMRRFKSCLGIACFILIISFVWYNGKNVKELKIEEEKKECKKVEEKTPIYLDATKPVDQRVKDLLDKMSLEEKAAQMVQGELKTVGLEDVKKYGMGSILSGGGSVPGNNTVEDWRGLVNRYQKAAISRELKIPIAYGIDAVHGHNNVKDAVIFPHNIGLGAANDIELMRRIGHIVGKEIKATGVHWNFAPCVAVVKDARWGRTYESFSESPQICSSLGSSFVTALQEEGVIATAKHYLGDGATEFGTGENLYLLDQGNVSFDETELRKEHLYPYKALVEEGVKTIMVSFSSFQGEKIHGSNYWIQNVLKEELGFNGVVISDWEGVHQIEQESFSSKVEKAVNAGIDVLMEPNNWKEAMDHIVNGVHQGRIKEERVNDAVERILRVKFEMGLFEAALKESEEDKRYRLGEEEHRRVAKEAVEKSLVLLKNEGVLPLKNDSKILVIGPGADDLGVQCGGWTIEWQGKMDERDEHITKGVTILEGMKAYVNEKGLSCEILEDRGRVEEADIILMVIGEEPYAEGVGDVKDLSLLGAKSLKGNKEVMAFARETGKKVCTIIVAGRPLDIEGYIDDWDATVMGWLPGSQGDGVATVLFGEKQFTGKLPLTWGEEAQFPIGYGLTYQP